MLYNESGWRNESAGGRSKRARANQLKLNQGNAKVWPLRGALRRYDLAEAWKDSGGSSEHCFQNALSDIAPSASCFKLEIVAAICPPSAESNTITTPSTAAPEDFNSP